MIIDAHCHVWPDRIAATVLAGRPADLDARHDGTIAGLRRTMDEAGIDRAVCLGVAHAARTVQRTNEFVPFGTVHPELSPAVNLKSLQDNGISGVKLHPLFQDLSLADPRVVDIAAALAQAGITVITHVGAGGDTDANDRGSPQSLRVLLDAVPGLRVIACHFGGYHRLDEAEELLVGSRAVLETSWPPSTAGLDPGRVLKIIARHGAGRVVYGSDWPMTDPAAEIAAIRALGLPPEDEAAILGDNLAALLGIS